MSDLRRLVSMPDDPKGRLIAIFVGAVLLPSLALSYVSMKFVKELAQKKEATEIKRAERTLYYVEKDLVETAHKKALEAAQMLGAEALLDGRSEVIKTALVDEGMGEGIFESLHLEGSSPRVLMKAHEVEAPAADPELSPDVLTVVDLDSKNGKYGEDSVPWPGEDGRFTGTLRFKFACDYVHGRLIREYFEKEFVNPAQSLVIRVTDGTRVVYETFPTTRQRFEVEQKMQSPSFRGLTLALRYRDYSIEQDVRRWRIGTLCLVGFIDLMLGAGLVLVYSNVRREMHLSRIKSDFVANVSHELKTPLALIRLFSETLELGRVPSDEKAKQYYRVINKESQRLTQLINNILDFSRIEAGRKEYRFAPADVGRIVGEVVDAYRFQIEQQGFTLEVDVAEDLPEVVADKEALGQALLNLVNNAVKYTRDEKYIRLQVRPDAGRVLISVTDRGIGVAKAEQRKIFEKFYRAEDSLVHETKGSGLGLPLVRHIMEAHGGSVEVESCPGKGSTFTLVLPVPAGGTNTKANK
jgi:signal transduction histidine kinase